MKAEKFFMAALAALAVVACQPKSNTTPEPEPEPEKEHVHKLEKVDGQAPTFEAAGFKDYYKCVEEYKACGNYWEDENGETRIGDATALEAWKSVGGNGYLPKLVENLVKCGDFADPTAWSIVNKNSDAVEVMKIQNGQLEIARATASDNNYRFICYTTLEKALEAGNYYKMAVKLSVPTPVTWYARGIDLAFFVSSVDPSTLDDYKGGATTNTLFFVDTDMESARQEVGPLHGTDGFVNFPTVCTYARPADLKPNGVFQAVEGMKYVGFYLRQRNTLKEMNTIIFDDVRVERAEAPVAE